MSKKVYKVYIGIPTTGTFVDTQIYALRAIESAYEGLVEFVWPDICVNRIFHDAARNGIVEDFLQSEADILWFLDSDVSPPTHVMDLVAVHGDKWQAAAAPYPVFMTQPGASSPDVVFTIYKGLNGGGLSPSDIPMSGLEWVDGAATGCLFLKREIFEKLEKPYFEFHYDIESRNLVRGEDIDFCLKLNKLGIKFFVDYSAVCKHKKTVDLLDVNNYAVNFAQRSVDAYDRQVRKNIEPLLKKIALLEEEKSKRIEREGGITKSGLIIPGLSGVR